MGQHKLPRQPVPVVVNADETTFKSCTTEVFRWVRSGIALVEQTPDIIKGLADDVGQAWKDSAKS